MDVFAGTAEYYDRYRPGVPAEVRDLVLHSIKTPVTLLDLGTGTGRVLEQFAPYFTDVIAVEPNHDMLELARRRLFTYPVHFMNCDAEAVRPPEDWHASLVTLCRVFHWVNRGLVLRKLDTVVAPRGVIAVFSEASFWELKDAWAVKTREVIREFLGPNRRTVRGPYQPPGQPYSQDFAVSPFPLVEKQQLPIVRHWTSDEIIGYLYSTSFASKELLGERAGRFEDTLKRELQTLSPNDIFTEHNTFEIYLARRAA
jgi:ubiquinone/menaquinone biosynthesis C-methylase UbiE